MLLSVPSGDGRMVAVDLRKKGMDEKSDQMDSELLCVEVIKVQYGPCYTQQIFTNYLIIFDSVHLNQSI